MSYSIIYRKMFVKFPNNTFLPFVEAGDSNVYDCTPSGGSGRRSREWQLAQSLLMNGGYDPLTMEQMIANLQKIHDRNIQSTNKANNAKGGYQMDYAEDGSDFGSYEMLKIGSNYASLKQFTNFVKNGCKNAKTIQELAQNNIDVVIKVKGDLFKTILSFDEYQNGIVWANDQLVDTNCRPNVKITSNWFIDKFFRKNKAVRKTNNPLEYDEKWAIGFDKGYFVRLTSRCMKYNDTKSFGKIFPSEKAAAATIKRLEKRFSYAFEAVKIG